MNSVLKAGITSSVFITVLLMAPVPAHAGWILTEQDGSRTMISEGKVKNIPGGGDDIGSVMDTNKEIVTMFDSKRRLYASGAIKDMCDEMKSMQDQMMGSMTPEEREMMEQMMSGHEKGETPEVTIRKTGKGGNIAGYETEKHTITVDGAPYGEVWLASDAALLKDLGAQRDKMVNMTASMNRCMSMGMETPDVEDSPQYTELEKKGIILKETVEGEVMTHIVKIEKADIPDSEFQAPKGYKKVTFTELMMAPEE